MFVVFEEYKSSLVEAYVISAQAGRAGLTQVRRTIRFVRKGSFFTHVPNRGTDKHGRGDTRTPETERTTDRLTAECVAHVRAPRLKLP